jgi:sec-independent protein translocase protein TatB
MFDIGGSELLLIGVVALIVVGPKDLPVMFRTLGRFTGQARAMAREFTQAMEKAADDAGMKDVQKDLRNIANPRNLGLDALNDATSGIKDWSAEKSRKTAAAKAGPESSTANAGTETSAKAGAESTSAKAGTEAAAKVGPATSRLSEERAEHAEKMRVAAARIATERKSAEATPAASPADAPAQPVDDKPA